LDIARVSIPTFVKRVREGKSIEEALKTPKGRTLVTRLGAHIVDGVEYENLPSIARAYGLKESLVYRRYHRGLRGTELIPPKLRKDYVSPAPKAKPPSRWQIKAGGATYRSIREACRKLGVEIHTFRNRRNRGCTIEQALGLAPIPKKPRKGAPVYEIDGKHLSLNEIAKRYGIDASTFKRRIGKGMSHKEAATKPSRRKKTKK
jgi:transposase